MLAKTVHELNIHTVSVNLPAMRPCCRPRLAEKNTLSPEKPANSKTLRILGGNRDSVCKYTKADKRCSARLGVHTRGGKYIGENESAPTKLNAPIPNDIPPCRCSWLGPLRQCRDLTRVCSSLHKTMEKCAKH